MASIPLPALGIQQQPGPIDQYAKAVQLKSLLGGQQIQQQEIQKNQMEIQQGQQDQADQQTLRKLYIQNNGDLSKTIDSAAKSGVSPATVEKLRQAHLQQMTQYLSMTKEQLANGQAIAKAVGDSASAVMNAPPELKDQVYQQEAARLLQMGVPKDQVPPQRPPDDVLKLHALAALSTKDQMDIALNTQKAADAIKEKQQADADRETRIGLEKDRLKLEKDRLDFEKNKPTSEQGTWTLQEDANGKSVLLNSKTGEQKAAPEGMVPKGTNLEKKKEYDKNVAPVDAAQQYAADYVGGGKYTGPGDEALLEKFFDLAKPSTGFRMSQPQMAMLQNSRSYMGSMAAKLRHATTGTWFSDEQRKQIANTMADLAKAKQSAFKGSPSTQSQPKADPLGIR